MTLQAIDYVNGITSIIYIMINAIIGLRIVSKYFKLEDKNFIYIGLAIIGIGEPWFPSGISFLSNLITGKGLSLEVYVTIGFIFIPIIVLFWLIGITNLINPQKTKLVSIIYIIIGVLVEIIFFTFLIINPTLIGTFSAESALVHIDIEYKTFILGYLLFVVANVLISIIIFSRKSLKSTVPEIRLKAKFILSALLLWTIGALLDTAIPLNLISLPITRILLVIAAFLNYIGFIMPQGIKKLILKE